MTRTGHPWLAEFLLDRFAIAANAEAMVGDALEQYASSGNRWRLWRQVASITAANVLACLQWHRAMTIGGVIGGWIAYAVSALPALKARNAVLPFVTEWLIDTGRYQQSWIFWTDLAIDTVIVCGVCLAIGWLLAGLFKNRAMAAVLLFAGSMLVVEGGLITYFVSGIVLKGAAFTTPQLLAPAAAYLARPIAVVAGGLLASRPARTAITA